MRFGTAEHQIIREDEDKEAAEKRMEGDEARKTGRPTSRIPTFQSSLARKRTTAQTAESLLPTKNEGSSREAHTKEREISSAEPVRTKLPLLGDRETALPVLSTRMHSSSTDNLSLADSSHPISETLEGTPLPTNRNYSPEPKISAAKGSEMLEELLLRPSLRVETEPNATDSLSEISLERQSVRIESFLKDEAASDSAHQEEVEEDLSSITPPEEHVPALNVMMEVSEEQDIESLGEDSEKAHVEETPCLPHCNKESVDDTSKQCLKENVGVLKKTKVPSETPVKPKAPDISARSKKVPSQAEHHKNTCSGVRCTIYVCSSL